MKNEEMNNQILCNKLVMIIHSFIFHCLFLCFLHVSLSGHPAHVLSLAANVLYIRQPAYAAAHAITMITMVICIEPYHSIIVYLLF